MTVIPFQARRDAKDLSSYSHNLESAIAALDAATADIGHVFEALPYHAKRQTLATILELIYAAREEIEALG